MVTPSTQDTWHSRYLTLISLAHILYVIASLFLFFLLYVAALAVHLRIQKMLSATARETASYIEGVRVAADQGRVKIQASAKHASSRLQKGVHKQIATT